MKRFNINDGNVKVLSRFKFVPVFLLVSLTLLFTTSTSAAELVTNGSFETPDLNDLTLFPAGTRAAERGWTTFYGQNFTGVCSDPARDWDKECNNDMLIPGWSVWWTSTLLMKVGGELVLNPDPDEPGRIEIQNNALADLVNPIRISKGNPVLISYAKDGKQKAELDSHDRYYEADDPATGAVRGELEEDNNVSVNQTLQTCPNRQYTMTYYWRSRTPLAGDNDVRVVVGDTVVRTHTMTTDWVKETVNFVSDDSYETEIAFISVGTGSKKGMSLDKVSVIGPGQDEFGNCEPPPPECVSDSSSEDEPQACAAPFADDSSSDGSSSDGSSSDGSSSDGSSSDDGSSEDGSVACGICVNGKLETLTLLYDGDDYTSHGQSSDKASVDPDPALAPLPVNAFIKVTEDKHDGDVLFQGAVMIGQLFEFEAENSVKVEIFDGSTLVQTIRFHASCSQPLAKLDTFGGITIWEASSGDGMSHDH